MDSFHDLEKSSIFEDKMIYYYFVKLLDELFDKHDGIIIDNNCETEKNQELIKNQAKIVGGYFMVPKRVLETQKCVRQTLKYIVEYLNSKYQFKHPLKMFYEKKSYREGKKVTSIGYTVFQLSDVIDNPIRKLDGICGTL